MSPTAPKPMPKARRDHIKKKLREFKHPTGKVNALRLRDEGETLAELCELHGLSVEDYRRKVGPGG